MMPSGTEEMIFFTPTFDLICDTEFFLFQFTVSPIGASALEQLDS